MGQGGSIEAEGPVIADGQVFVTSGYDKWAEMPGNMLLVFSLPNQTLTVLETLMNLVSRSALLIAALGIGLYLALQPTSPIDVDKTATVADARTSVHWVKPYWTVGTRSGCCAGVLPGSHSV